MELWFVLKYIEGNSFESLEYIEKRCRQLSHAPEAFTTHGVLFTDATSVLDFAQKQSIENNMKVPILKIDLKNSFVAKPTIKSDVICILESE
jgi:hypothetical protein